MNTARALTELEGKKIAALLIGLANHANSMMQEMLRRGAPLTDDMLITTMGTRLHFQVVYKDYLDADIRIWDLSAEVPILPAADVTEEKTE